MAGISASEKIPGKDIVILEKNQILGRKILATGNGRCNFSHVACKWEDYGKNGQALVKSIFSTFGPKESLKYFESLGIYGRADEEGRLYPYSLEGAGFLGGLLERLKENQVNIELEAEVKAIEKTERGFELSLGQTKILCEKLIIATGGKAGLRLGSTGDGYGFARSLGHSLVAPRPALVQVLTEEAKKENIKGVRVKGRVNLYLPGGQREVKLVSSEIGEIQFYQEGLSGISIFQLTRHMDHGPENYLIGLDLFPELELSDMEALLMARQKSLAKGQAPGLLRSLIPEKLIQLYLIESKIDKEERIGKIGQDKIKALAGLLKEKLYQVKSTKGWIEAQVTIGGISVEELDEKTLESRLSPGLYLVGELVDVDGPCGGWNLQWAWSSGYVAGIRAGKSILMG